MAGLPPTLPPNYLPMFESYWLQLEGSSNGEVNAITAAAFLKKSQLDEKILHKVWDLSDPGGKGYLDKQGFFTALRLVAACQCGREPAIKSIMGTDPPPKFVGLEQSIWSIESNERQVFNANFERLQPVNGLLSGEKVKQFLISSQLPMDVLGKIWNLADMDRDGNLDADEFAVAMKLITLSKKGEVLPLTLPMSLIPATKATKLGLAPPSSINPMTNPRAPSPIMPGKSSSDWVVTPDIKAKYDTYFEGIDTDRDGIVNGDQARGIFMASNLPSNVLAHIWNLCDIDKNGQLNKEQFALAMYLIAEKVKGRRELPSSLTPSMIPPSKRKIAKTIGISKSGGDLSGGVATSIQPIGSFDSTSSVSSTGLFSSSSTGLLQPTPSGFGGSTPSTTPLLPQPSSTSTSSLSNVGSIGSLLQPMSTGPPPLIPVGGGGGGGMFQSIPSGSTQVGGSAFVADFSSIKELDTLSTEIDSVRKDRQQLQQDIAVKQELAVKGKEKVTSLQSDLQEAHRQREQLEKQKQEVQGQLEEIDNQKTKMEVEIQDIKQRFQSDKEEIDRLQSQLREQETSKSQQQEELKRLQQQLQDMQREEQQLKEKIEASHNELQQLQSQNRSVHQKFDHIQTQLDQYRKEEQQLSVQIGSFAPGSSNGQNTPSMPELPSDLNIPSFGEADAISARATAGSSSPVSSISGFSTTSHTEEQNDERDRTDTLTTAAIPTDPFSSFPDPFGGSFNPPTSGGGAGGGQNNFSFDPFGAFKTTSPSNSSSNGGFASFPSVTSSNKQPPPLHSAAGTTTAAVTSSSSSGMESFATFSPMTIGTTSTQQHSTSSGGMDPFGSSDPFGTDPFSSVTTPKATTQTAWSGPSPFGSSDPFSQATPSDPFASSDPFSGSSSDPFGGNPFGSPAGFSSDPFASMTDNTSKTKK